MEDLQYLHHLQFLRVGQVSGGRVVAQDISLDVDVRSVDQPLLDILQHLFHHCIEGPQLTSYTEAYVKHLCLNNMREA